MHRNETKYYRGFTIIDFPLARVGDYEQHFFKVTDADKVEFTAVVKCSRTDNRILHLNQVEIPNLEQVGLHIVKGIIDSSRYSPGEEIEYWVPLEVDSADEIEIKDVTIRNEILLSLYRAMKRIPTEYKAEPMDIKGFCLVNKIDIKNLISNTMYLSEKSLIELDGEILDGNFNISITGIDAVETLIVESEDENNGYLEKDSIFISYRRTDSEGYAGRLYDALSGIFGIDKIFIDVEGIPPGSDFPSYIEVPLQSCQVMLVLIGPSWLNIKGASGTRRLFESDDLVRKEIKAGLDKGIIVIPVLLQNTPMPKEEELPNEIKELSARNAISLTHKGFNDEVNKLAQQITQAIRWLKNKTASDSDEEKVLSALHHPSYQYRSIDGIVDDTGIKKFQINTILRKLIDEGLVDKLNKKTGKIWFITDEGKKQIR